MVADWPGAEWAAVDLSLECFEWGFVLVKEKHLFWEFEGLPQEERD